MTEYIMILYLNIGNLHDDFFFQAWSDVTKLSFVEETDSTVFADIEIVFGDDSANSLHPVAFTSQDPTFEQSTLAHAFIPTNPYSRTGAGRLTGDVHFNDGYRWIRPDCEGKNKQLCSMTYIHIKHISIVTHYDTIVLNLVSKIC